MIPDKITIIISVVFLVLLITHYLAIKTGYNMGKNCNPNISMSKPAKTIRPVKKQPYIDPFEKEFLE